MSRATVVLPDAVAPTSATASPPRIVRFEAVEHGADAAVAEGDVLEIDIAVPVGQRRGVRRVGDRGFGREHLVDAAGRRRRTRELPQQHADHPQREDQHEHVRVGRDDVADRQVAVEHLVPAVPEDADDAERRQQVDQRDEVGAQPGLVDRTVVDVVGLAPRAAALAGARRRSP